MLNVEVNHAAPLRLPAGRQVSAVFVFLKNA
jgi:hypothetical protein